MKTTKKWAFLLLPLISFILAGCAIINSNPINYTENEGILLKSEANTIIIDYSINSNQGFYASIDFDLAEGQVDWEIINPKGELVYAGNVINEDGKTYRELTQPKMPNENMNKKEEITEVPDFSYLQFEPGSFAGTYKLLLRPMNAEGNYTVIWTDKLPRK